MVIFVLDGFTILFIILLAIGGAYTIINNIVAIIFGIIAIGAVFGGAYVIFTGIKAETILEKITISLQGFVMMTVCFVITILIDVGTGHRSFEKAQFILFGSIGQKMGVYLVDLILSLSVMVAISIVIQIAKCLKINHNGGDAFFNILAIILMFLIYIGGSWLALKDSFNNSIHKFDLETPTYELLEDTSIKNEFDFFFLTTGRFKAGTQLFIDGYDTVKKDIKYIEVTDGKRMGYVPESLLRELYTILYTINTDSPVYRIEEGYRTVTVPGGRSGRMKAPIATEEIVGFVTKGMQVDGMGTIYDTSDGELTYYGIILADGTEGCIKKEYIDEVKVPIDISGQ